MNISQIITLFITAFLSIGSLIIAYRQSKEKGFLFNNAYIYASPDERRRMNKTPYYKQSAIVFLGIGIIFFLSALNIIISLNWLLFIIISLAVLLVIYAIISSIHIAQKDK